MKKRTFAAVIVLAICAGIVLAILDTLRMTTRTRFSDPELLYAPDRMTVHHYHTLCDYAWSNYYLIFTAVAAHPQQPAHQT